jgi:uncharacterized membrane protein
MKHKYLVVFVVTAIVIAGPGSIVSLYLTAPLVYTGWENSAINHGQLSGAGVPVNTLYTEPNIPSPNSTGSSPLLLGNDPATLYTFCVLDLSNGPEILSVPNMGTRYYVIEFVDFRGDDFAYVGTRTTGTEAGNYLISGPGWHGAVPNGVTQVTSPANTVFFIGRVLVQNSSDVSTAYSLSKQIVLTPLSSWQTAAT